MGRDTLDKYEYKVRADEIKELIAEGDYPQAAEIADTIDWRRVKSVMMLCTISDLYKINRRYEDAKNMLLLAYERRPGGKTICYSLCELCIKTEEFLQAVNYYKEFVQVAPKDPGRYILQYKLYEAQDVSLEERIGVLEELKKRDYREKWAYELAYLYHRVGLATRCVEECDELILWFGDGKYVIKAMELKMLHQPLSASQQEKYDHRFDPVEEAPAAVEEPAGWENPVQEEAVQSGWGESEQDGTAQGGWGESEQDGTAQGGWGESGQNGTAQGGWGDSVWNAGTDDGNWQEGAAKAADSKQADKSVYTGWAAQGTEVSGDTRTDWVLARPAPVAEPSFAGAEKQPEPEELDIQVKTMDVGAYNTINLQAEIAAGLQEVLAENQAQNDAITRSIVAPLLDTDTESLDLPEIDEVDEDDLEPEAEVMEGTEVFFGETGELGNIRKEEDFSGKKAFAEERPAEESALPETPAGEQVSEKNLPAENVSLGKELPEEMVELHADETAKIVMDQLRMENMGQRVEQVLTAQPPREIAGVLSQESDGQISLVVPESEKIEKQITGQMDFEDILDEWEKLKRDNEAKRQEEVRQHVLEQTGNMFTEFEESVKDGLLEQLESEPVELDEEEIEEISFEEESGEVEPEEGNFEEAPGEGETEEGNFEEAPGEGETEEGNLEEEPGEGETEEGNFEEAPGEGETEEGNFEEELGEGETEEAEEGNLEESGEGETEEAEEGNLEESGEGETEEAEEGNLEEEPGEGETEETEERGFVEEPAEDSGKEEFTGEESEIVQRRDTKVRALTREEKELYAPFIQSRSGRERLVKAIDSISMAAYTGNVIITGEKGMDTLSLAKNMIREIQMADSNFSGKVAQVSGQGLNSKNIGETLERFKSGALIIRQASDMETHTIESLQKALQKENFGIIIFLEDTKKAIDKLLGAHPGLRECFTARMDVEALSNDSLVSFGRQYAREMEYSIDELGILALHTRIEERQTLDHVVTVMEVKDIVDEAIRHANRKTIGHFFDILFARRYDEEDMIILTEKDFV